MDQWEKLEEKLQNLEDKVDQEIYNEWREHPCTKLLRLTTEMEILKVSEFLQKAEYVNHEHGLTDAARAKGGLDALEFMLESSEYGAEEDQDAG